MSKVLCFSHHGIRCGVPVDRVIEARQRRGEVAHVDLWEPGEALPGREVAVEERGLGDRSLNLRTANGACWVSGEHVETVSVASHQVRALPPLLREIVTFPYVVGLAELGPGERTRDGELIWLVDPLRFSPGSAL